MRTLLPSRQSINWIGLLTAFGVLVVAVHFSAPFTTLLSTAGVFYFVFRIETEP